MSAIKIRKVCFYCGEILTEPRYVTTKNGENDLACEDCFLELTQGIIKNQNVNFFPQGGRGWKEDSPYQQNAIKDLENRFDN